MNNFLLKIIGFIVALIVGVFNGACSSQAQQAGTENQTQTVTNFPEPIVEPTKQLEPKLDDKQSSPIRKIDFRNFTYKEIQAKSKPAKLVNGKLEFETKYCMTELTVDEIEYADLTGDGEEEAIFSVDDFTACGSSAVASYFYVYTLRNNRLKLLWHFKTGAQAFGGLKDFRLDGKEIVFELYGKAEVDGTRPKVADQVPTPAECCPTHYTQFRLAWNGRKFEQKSAEVFPYTKSSI
jgi:hypothetical protein